MITDNDVKQLCQQAHSLREQHGLLEEEVVAPQFFRGQADYGWDDAHPGGCIRHMRIFMNYSAIPKYCFDCYKILITPRNVIELFKLMIIFTKIGLPEDNCRKALVEMRPKVSGSYKGIINCRNYANAVNIATVIQRVLSEKVATGIPVIIKRGCSEYPITYPEYANIGDASNKMEYKQEWQQIEDAADEHFNYSSRPDREMYNTPGYTLNDVNTMYYWLQYAAAIGDLSYLSISSQEVKPLSDVIRPKPFTPIKAS